MSFHHHNKRAWSAEEEKEMLDGVRRGEAFDQIGKRHDRTANAIRLRFGLVCRKELETKKMADVCREYNMGQSQVAQCISALEEIKKKQQPPPLPPLHDPATLDLIKEEILLLHEKVDKIYRHVRKLTEKKKNK